MSSTNSGFLEFVHAFQLGLKALQMYTAAHPRATEAVERVDRLLQAWMDMQAKVHISANANRIFVDGEPFEGKSPHLVALYRQMFERSVVGFVIRRGVTREELVSLLQLLQMKPSKIDELGGPEQMLKDLGTMNIEITSARYELVLEGDEGQSSSDLRGPAENAAGHRWDGGADEEDPEEIVLDADLMALLQDTVKLVATWKGSFQQALGLGRKEGGGTFKVNLHGLGGTAEKLGIADEFPQPVLVETLRRSLLSVSPEAQLGILGGLDTLPENPAGLRMAMQAVAPEIFAQAAASLLADGVDWKVLQATLREILEDNPQRRIMTTTLAEMLSIRGVDGARIQAMLQDLAWETMSLEARADVVLNQKGYFGIPPEQTLRFLRDLLEQGREDLFLRILDSILEGYTSEDNDQRETVAQVLAGVTHWILKPGLPEGAEARLLDAFRGNFGWEPLAQIHGHTTEAIAALLASLVQRGELAQAQALLQELMDLVGFLDDPSRDWREHALARLHARLCQDDLVERAIQELLSGSPDRMLTEFVPYMDFLGDAGAAGLVRMLEDEPDRHRRARLMEGIRGTGSASLATLSEALQSPTWYLVRNALNLLAELGDAGLLEEVLACFTHADGRVRRAAVRAAWKIGGPAAEQALLQLLPATDQDTQMEVLFALGQISSEGCIPVLAAYLLERRYGERLRHKAIEVLGQIGHADAVPVLSELLKRKGFLMFSRPVESQDIRIAAARALVALHQPAALEALRQAVSQEPGGVDRDALQAVLALASR